VGDKLTAIPHLLYHLYASVLETALWNIILVNPVYLFTEIFTGKIFFKSIFLVKRTESRSIILHIYILLDILCNLTFYKYIIILFFWFSQAGKRIYSNFRYRHDFGQPIFYFEPASLAIA